MMRITVQEPIEAPDPKTIREPYKMSTSIGFLLHDVARFRRNIMDRALKTLRITRSQRWVLVYLSQYGDVGINQRNLAEAMKMGPVAISEHLVLLEALGCIQRRTDPQDRRQKIILLTDKGYEVLYQSRAISSATNARILAGITPEDIAATERTLLAMHHNMIQIESSAENP